MYFKLKLVVLAVQGHNLKYTQKQDLPLERIYYLTIFNIRFLHKQITEYCQIKMKADYVQTRLSPKCQFFSFQNYLHI